MENESTQIIFGLRHKRTFGLWDKIGATVDSLVALNGTNFFPQELFINIDWTGDGRAAKVRDKNDDFSVRIDMDNIVLSYNKNSHWNFKDEELASMFNEICSTILPLINSLDKIDRIGIVDVTEFNYSQNAAKIISDALLSIRLEKAIVDTCEIRAIYKVPAKKSFLLKDRDDYSTIIIEVSSKKKEGQNITYDPDLLRVSLDFQYYFIPSGKYVKELVPDHYARYKKNREELLLEKLKKLYNPST
jgi:hypothetical protein